MVIKFYVLPSFLVTGPKLAVSVLIHEIAHCRKDIFEICFKQWYKFQTH